MTFTQGEAKGQTFLRIDEVTEESLRIDWSESGKARPTDIA